MTHHHQNMLMDERFVAVNPSLIRATGSASRAIVLQALWWARDRDTGKTTMTGATVAERTGLSPRTVERATVWLREAGVLSRGKVSAFDHTSVWVVAPNAAAILTGSFSPNSGTGTDRVAGSDSDRVAGSDSDKVAESSYENPENPPTGENTLALVAPLPGVDDGFDQFWSLYPRKAAKADARKAWKAARKSAPLQVILDGLSRFQGREAQFVPYPATYLRGRRWEDEPESLTPRDRQAGRTGTWDQSGGFFGQGGAR